MQSLHDSQGARQYQSQTPRGESQHRPRPTNPWLAAEYQQFRHPDDGRKWRIIGREKRLAMRAFVLLGTEATARQIAVLQLMGVRRVEAIIRILKKQGFLSNGARVYRRDAHGRRDFASERQRRILHPEKLLPRRESCGPRRESCGGNTSSTKDQTQDKPREPQKTRPTPAPLVCLKGVKPSQHRVFVTFATQTFRQKFGCLPTWGKKDFKNLSDLLKRSAGNDFERRWTHYLDSTENFIVRNGYSLAIYCYRFDALRDGPILQTRSKHHEWTDADTMANLIAAGFDV
jgi:hypothetical protein